MKNNNILKLTTVFLLVAIFVTGTLYAQTLSDSSTDSSAVSAADSADSAAESQVDLKESVARETAKRSHISAEVDVNEMNKIERQQRVPQKTWNTKKVILVTALVVAIVGLAVVLAYNTKRCIKREPSGCDFVNDLNCKCLEYAK